MSIRPESIANDLIAEMFTLLERGHLVTRDSAEMTHFLDQINKMDPGQHNRALSLRATAYHLYGDVAAALEQLAGMTSEDGRHPDFDRLCVLANLGFAQEGLAFYKRVGSPESGMFTTMVPAAVSIGAFRTIGTHISRAISMHLSNLGSIPTKTLTSAARILQERGTEDEQVAAVLAVSGEVLRSYGLVFLGRALVDTFDEQGLVRLCFRLAVTPEQAASLYMELLDRLDERDIKMPPGFLVDFEGAQITTPEHEESHA